MGGGNVAAIGGCEASGMSVEKMPLMFANILRWVATTRLVRITLYTYLF